MPKHPPHLPTLVPSPDPNSRSEVQQTAFSHDVFGRYVCNDWDEVRASISDGGYPFDAIIIGAGMFGAYCAAKLHWRGQQGLRVLVLDAGTFVLPEHIQNLPQRLGGGLGGPRYARRREDGTGTHNLVWGMPWISNEAFPGLAYCLGGRSLFFGGWAPRLTAEDLARWPQEVRDYLGDAGGAPSAYERIEREIGIVPDTDYLMGPFLQAVEQAFKDAAPNVPTVTAVERAPLAVQGASPHAGLFPFGKFSSGPFLIDAVRADVERAMRTYGDRDRSLFIVPRAHVLSLGVTDDAVSSIDVVIDGRRERLAVERDCAVVLANGTIEATRLALDSLGVGSRRYGSPRVGNLMAHLRSNVVFRIKRAALGLSAPPRELETTALLVRGESGGRRYHLQVTAGAVGTNDSEKNLWKQVPDIDLQDEMRANQDPSWVAFTVRGIGEMEDERTLEPQPSGSWIDLSSETDEWGVRRAYVHLVPTQGDLELWHEMDRAAFALAEEIAGDPGNVEYWNRALHRWEDEAPTLPVGSATPYWRDPLGSTHHEGGTLFMGEHGGSITDANGKFHHLHNAYAVGPATFPTIASANPALTGLTLARRTAGAIIEAAGRASLAAPGEEMARGPAGATDAAPVRTPGVARDAGFSPLSLDAADWTVVSAPGTSPRMRRFEGLWWETFGGYGLLWYTKEELSDFELYLEWRVARADDNSGVYIRVPRLDGPDSLAAVDSEGHEIQIDESGSPDGAPIHRTGAIYGLQGPSSFASRPIGTWNSFLIRAKDSRLTVTLNGVPVNDYESSRRTSGYIALQAHHFGSRVQFRHLQLRKLR